MSQSLTTFSRVLRDEQKVAFRDFDFPLDAAYNVRVERDLANAVPVTVVESGEHGWFWQIDTYDQRGLGYVFGSKYVDDQAALAEFLRFVEDVVPSDADPGDPDAVERFTFSSGYYEQAWVDNCLAIGNAEGFVEPLQSTALTASPSNSVQLARLLSAHGRLADDALREAYNRRLSVRGNPSTTSSPPITTTRPATPIYGGRSPRWNPARVLSALLRSSTATATIGAVARQTRRI
jgi:tryptophan halogenase